MAVHFNAATFSLCNWRNTSCASFGEKKKRSDRMHCFTVITMNQNGLGVPRKMFLPYFQKLIQQCNCIYILQWAIFGGRRNSFGKVFVLFCFDCLFCLFLFLSFVCLFACWFVCLFVCLFVCVFVYLFVCLFVCFFGRNQNDTKWKISILPVILKQYK